MRIFRSLTIAAVLASASAGLAFADIATENYVRENGNEVLRTLNDPNLDNFTRTQRFSEYMDRFADLERVSNFVIGKYSRRFSEDELTRYRAAFKEYALTVYEAELDRFRGEELIVKNSVDRSAKDSIVNSTIVRADGETTDVRWRVLNRGGYQVVDVAIDVDGNVIWLAIEQRAQFLALLDKTNGSADALIRKIESMTNSLAAENIDS